MKAEVNRGSAGPDEIPTRNKRFGSERHPIEGFARRDKSFLPSLRRHGRAHEPVLVPGCGK